MHDRLRNSTSIFVTLCLLFALSVPLLHAQDNDARILQPNGTVTDTLSNDVLAQVYAFRGSVGQSVQFTLETGPGVAILVTDSSGEPLARSSAGAGSGRRSIEIPPVVLTLDGSYYVTVFVYSDAFVVADGEFALTLNVGSETSEIQPTAVVESTPVVEPTVAATEAVVSTGYITPSQIVTGSGLQVTLTWANSADLNLQLRDPVNGDLYWDSRSTASGGSFGFDANGLCEVLTSTPAETATYPGGALATGSYELLVYYRSSCQNEGATEFTIEVVLDGVALEPIQGTLLPPIDNEAPVFVGSFFINTDGTVTFGQTGVYAGNVGPSTQNLPTPAPLTLDVPVQGFIVDSQPYQTYSFNGQANDIVSINATATAGSLDTLMFLLGPNNNVVYTNDDVEFGITNSGLNNVRLPITGTYTLVVTRYGQNLGGTEGEYELLLTGPTGDLPAEVLALNLPAGDITMTLFWNTGADLQLLVRDPSGNSVFDDTPTVPSGGRLVAAGNVNCTQSQTQPVSYIYWPQGFLRAGTYEVDVWYQSDCGDTTPVDFTLVVEVDGNIIFTDTVRPLPNNQYVSSFNIDVNRQVTVFGGGIMSERVMDFQSQLADAPSVAPGQPARGTLSFENPFDVYVFEGQQGEIVNIGLNQISGNLDTLLYVLDPNGNLLQVNDDAVVGDVTNSLVGNLTLQFDGQYIVLATRFGILYGATSGGYELTLTRQN